MSNNLFTKAFFVLTSNRVVFFIVQTILLQNMYQNPQSAAQVADGTSESWMYLLQVQVIICLLCTVPLKHFTSDRVAVRVITILTMYV